MFEQIVLGIIQGVTEWLPISSSGMIALAKEFIFHEHLGLEAMTEQSLFLHLGTFLAALVYFRPEVVRLCQDLLHYKSAPQESQKLLQFLIVSTLVSGVLGLVLIKTLSSSIVNVEIRGRFATLMIGVLLLVTSYFEVTSKKIGYKSPRALIPLDGILLGIVQGCAVLPGLSRSGTTVAALLLRKFDRAHALRMSFLMSLPIVLGGNILLNIKGGATWSLPAVAGLTASFVFGLLTIHLLLRLAEKINFGYFLLFFGTLTIFASKF